MEEELTYEQLINKVDGASSSLFALSKRLDRYHKRNSDEDGNPMNALRVAAEVIRNFTYTMDTLAEVMAVEAPEE